MDRESQRLTIACRSPDIHQPLPLSDMTQPEASASAVRPAKAKRQKLNNGHAPVPATSMDVSASTPARNPTVISLIRGKVGAKYLRKHSSLIKYSTQGFLLCCDTDRETESMLQMKNILQQYVDRLYPLSLAADSGVKTVGVNDSDSDREGDEPIPVASTSSGALAGAAKCRWSLVGCGGITGLAFLALNTPTNVPLMTLFLQLVCDCRSPSPSHTLTLPSHINRIVPVQCTATAEIPDKMVERFSPVLALHFSDRSVSFAIHYRSSNNRIASRSTIIAKIAERIDSIGRQHQLSHSVNLTTCDKVVFVWVVKSCAMMSVFDDYQQLHQYNVKILQQQSLTRIDSGETSRDSAVSDTGSHDGADN